MPGFLVSLLPSLPLSDQTLYKLDWKNFQERLKLKDDTKVTKTAPLQFPSRTPGRSPFPYPSYLPNPDRAVLVTSDARP